MNMKKFVLSGVSALILFGVAGGILWWLFGGDPAAATPTAPVVSVRNPDGQWATVGPNPSGHFEVLPSVFPNAGLRFYLYAPSPTRLSIDLDGQALPNMPGAGGTSATGYFRVLDVDTSFNPAKWEIEIQPPDSKMSSTMMAFKIADVSFNPRFTGTDHISTPVTVTLVARKLYSVSVTLSGMGSGSVSSNMVGGSPPGINCPPQCAFDFMPSVTVTLTPSPASNSTFAGWSNACVSFGSSGNCTLTLNGIALSAGAAFRPTPSGGPPPPPNCPAPNPPTGWSHWNEPFCPASVVGAFLSCDSQKYFCCTDSACLSRFRQAAITVPPILPRYHPQPRRPDAIFKIS
jgi:hypothetical protein